MSANKSIPRLRAQAQQAAHMNWPHLANAVYHILGKDHPAVLQVKQRWVKLYSAQVYQKLRYKHALQRCRTDVKKVTKWKRAEQERIRAMRKGVRAKHRGKKKWFPKPKWDEAPSWAEYLRGDLQRGWWWEIRIPGDWERLVLGPEFHHIESRPGTEPMEHVNIWDDTSPPVRKAVAYLRRENKKLRNWNQKLRDELERNKNKMGCSKYPICTLIANAKLDEESANNLATDNGSD